VRSEATTVEEYLAELPDDRREVIAAVRDVVNAQLPEGYAEEMGFGMINWVIPLADYPTTYNKQPLMIAALASQKNHMALYLMGLYADGPEEQRFRDRYAARTLKLDMGKSCVRFKKLADVDLEAVAEVIAAIPPLRFTKMYEASRRR
jgi:uncharacterized protein YdhG (YjbR/CyaY superfamily)